jgi:dihydroneopterin aldolase
MVRHGIRRDSASLAVKPEIKPDAPQQVTVLRQTVAVDDVRVEAYIGVHGHEKNRRQSLIVGVELEVLASEGDTIADTVDYNRIVDACRELADRGIGLIETYARQLGEELLADPRILRAEVTVAKPGALPNGVARTEVTMVRSLRLA